MKINTNPDRPGIMQAILTVAEKQFITPHYIRIVLTGDIETFALARAGDNNKIVLPDTTNGEIILPDFSAGAPAKRPLIRTYTMRALDTENGTMTIDFVGHGENGPASRWATHAKPGDQLGVLMKVKSKPLFLPAEYYLIVGDHTALPVISVILENLPAKAQGTAVIEVFAEEDIQLLQKPENIELVWKFNQTPGETSALTTYFETAALPADCSRFVYVAAEFNAVNHIQELLRNKYSLRRDEWYAYSYWKFGQAEDASSQERRDLSKTATQN